MNQFRRGTRAYLWGIPKLKIGQLILEYIQKYKAKTYYKVTTIQTVWHWHKEKKQNNETKQRDQKKTHIYNHKVYNKNANAIQWEIDGLSYYSTESTGCLCEDKNEL